MQDAVLRQVTQVSTSPLTLTTVALPFPRISPGCPAIRRRVFLPSVFLPLVFLAVVFTSACSDSPTAVKEEIPQAVVDLILPNVEHARANLAPAIEDAAVRRSVEDGMSELESGIRSADARATRLALTNVKRLVEPYEAAHEGSADGPDVSALMLELDLVEQQVGSAFAKLRG